MSDIQELSRKIEPVAPAPAELPRVEELSEFLDRAAHEKMAGTCALIGPAGERIDLPPTVFQVLEQVAELMARGDSVMVVPYGRELTTQQAANLLNMSRQFLVNLVDRGDIPATRTGRHRRLKIVDVLAYRARRAKARRKSLDRLASLGEEVGGYDTKNR